MSHTPKLPHLPGAVGLTHLMVYDWPGPDGLCGGSPHVHLTCTECYYVLAGHGSVQTLSVEGFHEIELIPGKVVWFSPGVVHRLINADKKLELLVIMQNAGLPEAGDFFLTFAPEYLADPAKYAEGAGVAPGSAVFADNAENADPAAIARRRRDLAVVGFNAMRSEFQFQGKPVMLRFYAALAKLAKSHAGDWYRRWSIGAQDATESSGAAIVNLRHGHAGHLLKGQVGFIPPPTARRYGVCGMLGPYVHPEGPVE